MKITNTVDSLFLTKLRFEQLANDLEAAGHELGAAELRHQLEKMSQQFMDLERVLKNHQVAISTLRKTPAVAL
ncbi:MULTISPECIES: hypothetical protein [unclassified Halomonas]|uniref:hypothetical protein n=1 Tax=unclassified Halomonas TaxID=2609666 RepID=UPI0007D9842E|nr:MULTISPECIES: hypothetical protein [unclassified Halomonas]MBT2784782.1 hypothetical protein [Halomonas sp. ISL-106]MBT2796476.1 hypothetical protein [Halomonas sp. ISL-104]OAL59724.1 hypothetical protein A6R74_00140 [Halomonas sp. ALS9]